MLAEELGQAADRGKLSGFLEEIARPRAGGIGGEMLSSHTFNVVLAMTGETKQRVTMPLNPTPTFKSLQARLHACEPPLLGNLVQGTTPLKQDHVFSGLAPGGETEISFIKGNYIQVHEAGLYNGIYEQWTTNEGRPAFKMITPDNPKSFVKTGERHIYYSSVGQQIVPGWKCNNRYMPQMSEWDMLAPGGPRGMHIETDDVPEGKFDLYNGGTGVKSNAPKITRALSFRTPAEKERASFQAAEEEQENIDSTECGGCFNGEARVLMADGTYKLARDVQVGDQLQSASGGSTSVEACVREAKSQQQLIQIGDLLITPHHPVVHDGRWVFPHQVPGSRYVDADMELCNFITSNREAIHVEGLVATSIGTYCEGLHDLEQNPEHRVWGTDLIVFIYQQHPQWPNITSSTVDTVAAVTAAMDGARDQLWRCQNAMPAIVRKGSQINALVVAGSSQA